MTVTIVDYGLGNLDSVRRALVHEGSSVIISEDPAEIAQAERLVLPGVGAFGEGMANLRQKGLMAPIAEVQRQGRPILGICLGMQLIFSQSEEMGVFEGLGLIPGQVVRFPEMSTAEKAYKIPHVGWNHLLPKPPRAWSGTILDGVEEGAMTYFVHSYVVQPQDPACILAQTRYGTYDYCSVVQIGNLAGCQFHPEKSGEVGLKILKNFLTLL